jgi:hypothetical protein
MKYFDLSDGKAVIRQIVGVGVIAMIGILFTSFKLYKENTQKGVDAFEMIQVIAPKVDTIKAVVERHIEKESRSREADQEAYERRTYRDSVRAAEALRYMDILIENLKDKKSK